MNPQIKKDFAWV